MGTVLASTIITRVRTILNDTIEPYQWSDADLLSYINAAQRNICFIKPDAYIRVAATQLAAGTKQSVTDGAGLVKVTRNMGTDGATAGRPVSFVLMEQFNYLVSGFHTDSSSATVEVYTYDKDIPGTYWVYPPQPTSNMGYVEEVYEGLPANLASTSSAITLSDHYEDAIMNYVLYRAYSREVDGISDAQATKYYNLYVSELGRKDLAESTLDPAIKG